MTEVREPRLECHSEKPKKKKDFLKSAVVFNTPLSESSLE